MSFDQINTRLWQSSPTKTMTGVNTTVQCPRFLVPFAFNPIIRYSSWGRKHWLSAERPANQPQVVSPAFPTLFIRVRLYMCEYFRSVFRMAFVGVDKSWINHIGDFPTSGQREFAPLIAVIVDMCGWRPCIILYGFVHWFRSWIRCRSIYHFIFFLNCLWSTLYARSEANTFAYDSSISLNIVTLLYSFCRPAL